MFAFQLRPDRRRFRDAEDGRSACRRCGGTLLLLPEDRRLGYCFDCYDPSELRATAY